MWRPSRRKPLKKAAEDALLKSAADAKRVYEKTRLTRAAEVEAIVAAAASAEEESRRGSIAAVAAVEKKKVIAAHMCRLKTNKCFWRTAISGRRHRPEMHAAGTT